MSDLTVVMSVFNGEKYLSLAIESILNQTFKDFKFLIINNGSTDNTELILNYYTSIDKRIKIITNKKTLSVLEAREQGIIYADSEWIALMDADDYALPERLSKQINFIKEEGVKIGALGTYAIYIDHNGRDRGLMKAGPTSGIEYIKAKNKNEAIVIVDPSAIIHRQSFLDVGGYRVEYHPAGDLDLWYRISEIGREIRTLPEYLIKYRIHDASTSSSEGNLQRMKTHFANHNMRLRRKKLIEISFQEFTNYVQKKHLTRLRWFFNDNGMVYFKKAAIAYGEDKYLNLVLFLIISIFFKPSIFFRKLIPHLKNSFENK